jgi:hypothetical protein
LSAVQAFAHKARCLLAAGTTYRACRNLRVPNQRIAFDLRRSVAVLKQAAVLADQYDLPVSPDEFANAAIFAVVEDIVSMERVNDAIDSDRVLVHGGKIITRRSRRHIAPAHLRVRRVGRISRRVGVKLRYNPGAMLRVAPETFVVPDFQPAYLNPQVRRSLPQRAVDALGRLACCRGCPRDCRVNRLGDELGACQTGRLAPRGVAYAGTELPAPKISSQNPPASVFMRAARAWFTSSSIRGDRVRPRRSPVSRGRNKAVAGGLPGVICLYWAGPTRFVGGWVDTGWVARLGGACPESS